MFAIIANPRLTTYRASFPLERRFAHRSDHARQLAEVVDPGVGWERLEVTSTNAPPMMTSRWPAISSR